MAEYIPKSDLVAEIMSRIDSIEVSQKAGLIKKRDAETKIILFKSILSLIDTIETKEVDLEKEMQAFAKMELEPLEIHDDNIGISITMSQLYSCARHFFKLGLKVAQKGE